MNVVVIPEENVPFAGMHDLITVLLTGHHFFAKNTDHRNNLLQFITDLLISIEPEFSEYIHWNNVPKEADAYLVHARPENEATFASYFGTRNSLIRGKRIAVGVVSPDDNAAVFKQLGEDIFTFWGLSPFCVRKIFIPAKFPFNLFFESIDEFAYLYQHNRYANNYDYHKSVFMMDRIPFYDNGFLILRESSELHVPPGCLYYEFYDTIDDVISKTKTSVSEIQQVITNLSEFPMAVKPGDAHNYKLWEFTDHKDTLGFLL
jgi:Predicted acetyltransferase involved in intracellular survival and related acetyltransferases